MNFGEALECLKNGLSVRRSHWAGYWKKDGDTVKMHCRDGRVLDIRETEDVFYTLQNIASEDWEACDLDPDIDIPEFLTMRFGEALRQAKSGKQIARKGWNGKGMAVAYQPGYPDGVPCNKNTADVWNIPEGSIFRCQPYLQMRCVDGTYQMWLASQSDILAEDWYIV